MCAVAGAILLGTGLFLDKSDGWPERLPDHIFEHVGGKLATSERQDCVGIDPKHISSDTLLECPPLVGVARVVRDSKRPCKAFTDKILDVIGNTESIQTVILSARWAAHAEAGSYGYEGGDRIYLQDEESQAHSLTQNREVFVRGFYRTLAAREHLGKNVVIFGSVPEIGINVPQSYFSQSRLGRQAELTITKKDYDDRQSTVTLAFKQAAEAFDFTLIQPANFFHGQKPIREEGL